MREGKLKRGDADDTPLVVTAGLTPAWQRLCVLDELRMGEVNRSSEVYPCASGKAINAGIALQHLGGTSLTLTPLGGVTGTLVEEQLESLGLDYRRIETARPTRVCNTLINRGGRSPTEIVEDAESLASAELDAFVAAYAEAVAGAALAIVTGSLPKGTSSSIYRDLLGRTPCPVILDARGPELLAALEKRPLVVKPNRPELCQTVGRRLDSDGEVIEAMRDLAERGARWVVVSDGEHPLFVLGEGRTLRIVPPRVSVVNPIASGDCLAAGLAWALARGRSMLESLRLGVAAASANAAQLLPGRLDLIEVLRLAETIEIIE